LRLCSRAGRLGHLGAHGFGHRVDLGGQGAGLQRRDLGRTRDSKIVNGPDRIQAGGFLPTQLLHKIILERQHIPPILTVTRHQFPDMLAFLDPEVILPLDGGFHERQDIFGGVHDFESTGIEPRANPLRAAWLSLSLSLSLSCHGVMALCSR